MASLKQATYLREQYPDSKVQIFYIDIRTPGRYEQFYWKVKDDPNVTLTKGKVAKITEDPSTKDVIVEAEDIMAGKKIKAKFDMVVLAAGMVPSTKNSKISEDIISNDIISLYFIYSRRLCCSVFSKKRNLCSRDIKEPC